MTSELIGQKLKNEGIHPKEYSGKISKIMGGLYGNPDIKHIKEKLERIKKHYEKNKQDKRAKIELTRMIHLKKKMDAYLLKKQN